MSEASTADCVFRFLSTVDSVLYGYCIHEQAQAQYTLCELCVFKRHNKYKFFNFARECESSESVFFLLMKILCPYPIEV